MHHGESEPHLSDSPTPAPRYALALSCTEIHQTNAYALLLFLFLPLFLAFALPKGLLLQQGLDRDALA